MSNEARCEPCPSKKDGLACGYAKGHGHHSHRYWAQGTWDRYKEREWTDAEADAAPQPRFEHRGIKLYGAAPLPEPERDTIRVVVRDGCGHALTPGPCQDCAENARLQADRAALPEPEDARRQALVNLTNADSWQPEDAPESVYHELMVANGEVERLSLEVAALRAVSQPTREQIAEVLHGMGTGKNGALIASDAVLALYGKSEAKP